MPASLSASSPRGARLRQLLLGAQIGPHRVVELQVAAAGVVERLDGLAVELGEVVEVGAHVGIGRLADGLAPAAEVHHRRRGDGHLRRDLGVGLQELEVLEHGMVGGKVELARDLQALGLGLRRRGTGCRGRARRARSPSRCQKKSKCHQERRNSPSVASCRPTSSCLPDDLPDLLVLDRLQLGGVICALLALGARVLERRGAQQAADHVGTEGRRGRRHGVYSSCSTVVRISAAATARDRLFLLGDAQMRLQPLGARRARRCRRQRRCGRDRE